MENILREILESRKKSVAHGFKYLKECEIGKSKNRRKSLSESINDNSGISIISEIKPASPTLGEIKEISNVFDVAREMENAGVVGLSVLTEPEYFKGSYENLRLAVEATTLPCLMKDFVIDEVQFEIAAKIGATNILLITALGNLEKLYEFSLQYDLEPLIEIHTAEEIKELERLVEIGMAPKLIGVNNRKLNTLKIDLSNSKNLIPRLKEDFGDDLLVISESGIRSFEDIQCLLSSKADAFLVGSSIMKSNNIEKTILSLRGV
jgi:indole-3-glycerol phosphate synthase